MQLILEGKNSWKKGKSRSRIGVPNSSWQLLKAYPKAGASNFFEPRAVLGNKNITFKSKSKKVILL